MEKLDSFEQWLSRQRVKKAFRKLGKRTVPDSYEEWLNKRVLELTKKPKKTKGEK